MSTTLAIPPQPPRVAAWRQPAFWLQSGMGLLAGGAVTFVAIRSFEGAAGVDVLLLVLAFALIVWLQIVWHEAGHALGGLLAGHRALAFGVGPLRLERQGERWRFRWAGSIRGIGGFALLFPREGEGTRAERAAYLLGGPLTNLLAAAVAWPFALVEPGASAGWSETLARLVVGTGLLIGLSNLVPFLAGGWASDGRQLWKLWQNADEARAMAALSRLGSLSLAGIRPRDWPLDSAAGIDLATLPQGIAEAFARCRMVQALDARDFRDPAAVAAAATLASGFWQGPEGIRPVNALLLARWTLDAARDPELAAQWAALGEGGILDQSAQRAVLAAWIALRRGDSTKAASELQSARALRNRIHDAASLQMHDEDLAAISKELAAAAARAPTAPQSESVPSRATPANSCQT